MTKEEVIAILKPAAEAMGEWLGTDGPFDDVADNLVLDAIRFVEENEGKRKSFKDAADYIADWEKNGKKAFGYLLEIRREGTDKWVPFEFELAGKWNSDSAFDVDEYFGGFLWNHLVVGGPHDEWTVVGESCTWLDRLGVPWDSTIAVKDPHISGIWGGGLDTNETGDGLWRVTRVEFVSRPSEKIKEFIMEHPDYRLLFKDEGSGEYR